MYYTYYNANPKTQLSLADILAGTDTEVNTEDQFLISRKTIKLNANQVHKNLGTMIEALHELNTLNNNNFVDKNLTSLYTKFYIPKHSGGMREINAPNPELMTFLRTMKDTFESKLRVIPNPHAFAYVKKTCAKNAVEQHQKNQSNWFLKLDVKDFFPSCSKELIMSQLLKCYPFTKLDQTLIEPLIDTCLLNGGLPQGTPMSPLLTNLIMIPFDYELSNQLNNYNGTHFVYTRYADDILISSYHQFDRTEICHLVQNIFNENGYENLHLKTEKTRYGSRAGSNWNLGLMLNKENQITVGSNIKNRARASIYQFLHDLTAGNRWSIMDTQILQGQISYYQSIEPEYFLQVIRKYSEKFGVNFHSACKEIINGN